MRVGSLEQNQLSPQPETQNNHQIFQTQNLSHPKFPKQNSELLPTKSIPNPSNWSSLIKNYISQGAPREALVTYSQIRRKGFYLLSVVPLLLKASASLSILRHGKALHAESIKYGVDLDVTVGTSLVSMYAKCCDIVYSRKVFDHMPERNVVTWNAMIGGYIRNGDIKFASILFEQMSKRTAVTWIEMIDGFASIGDTVSARSLFDQVPHELRNVVTWTVMVDGYTSNGETEAARKV